METTVADRPRMPLARPSPLRPAAELARLRDAAAVCAVTAPTGEPAWLVTRYAEALAVLTDQRFAVALSGVVADDGGTNDSLFQDGPGHTRLRALVSRAFTPRTVAELRPRTAQLTHEHIDRLLADGPAVDLMSALAFPVPITVISELLGVPVAQRAAFRESSDALLSLSAAGTGDPGAGWLQVSAQVGELIEDKRRSPGDDLLSALAAVRDADEDRLTPAELAMMVVTLITAGYVSTAVAVGVGVILLTEHGQWRRLHDEPRLVPAAVEEVLRFQAVAGDLARVATADVRIGDTTVRAGDKVLVSLAAVNRDERRFADPDRFDITRADDQHLTFGRGVHHCLGAALARVELEVVLGALAARLPDLRVDAAPEDLTWQRSELMGDEWPRTVPVRWTS